MKKMKARPRNKPFDAKERQYLCGLDAVDACTEKRITWNQAFIAYTIRNLCKDALQATSSAGLDAVRKSSAANASSDAPHDGARNSKNNRNRRSMMNRNHDPIVKATVIIVACIVATIMICVECALLPRYGWLWLVLLGLIATAIIFCVVTIVLAWRHGKGGRR